LEGGPDPDGPAHGSHLDGQLLLQFVKQVEGILSFEVELVDEDDHRGIAHPTYLHEAFGLGLHSFDTVYDEDHTVHGGECPIRILGEITVTWRIEEVDELPAIFEGHDRCGDRDATLALDLHEVTRGTAADLVVLDGACGLDGTAVKQELLGQRGLAGIRVADDGEGSPSFDLKRSGHCGGTQARPGSADGADG
jgi:hypothetical protein